MDQGPTSRGDASFSCGAVGDVTLYGVGSRSAPPNITIDFPSGVAAAACPPLTGGHVPEPFGFESLNL